MNATTKTLEQLQAEAQAAAEALQAAQRAAQEAEREAKYAAQRAEQEQRDAAERAKQAAVLAPIAAAFAAAGISTNYAPGNRSFSIAVDTQPSYRAITVSVEAEQFSGSSSGWYSRSRPTGRYLVVLRSDSTSHRYPPLKAGGYNTAKMIEVVKAKFALIAAQNEAARVKASKLQSAAELAEQVRAENGYAAGETNPVVSQIQHSYPRSNGRGYEYTTYTPKPGHIFLQLGNYEATPEEAKLLLNALKAINAMRAANKK
jgi:hypothetical protein